MQWRESAARVDNFTLALYSCGRGKPLPYANGFLFRSFNRIFFNIHHRQLAKFKVTAFFICCVMLFFLFSLPQSPAVTAPSSQGAFVILTDSEESFRTTNGRPYTVQDDIIKAPFEGSWICRRQRLRVVKNMRHKLQSHLSRAANVGAATCRPR